MSLTIEQGLEYTLDETNCADLTQSAVDYRGDITLTLKTGEELAGFAFNAAEGLMELLVAGTIEKRGIQVDQIARILFSGKDEAKGKSWQDYQKRKLEEAGSLQTA